MEASSLCLLFFISWHLFAPKTQVFGRDDVTVAPQIHKTNEDVGRSLPQTSPRSSVSDYSGESRPQQASNVEKSHLATAAVSELYEVRAKAEAEDAQLRTGSDTE